MATKKAPVTKRSSKKISVSSELTIPSVVLTTQTKSTKKTSAKKPVAKKTVRKVAAKKPEMIVVEEVTLGPTETLKVPGEVSKEYVVVHRCTNCDHVPFSVTRLVTLFSVLIVLLSVSVLIQVGTIDLAKLVALVSTPALAASQWMHF